MNPLNPKHNSAVRRRRLHYFENGTRSDGAIVIRLNPTRSRSKYVPHVGKKQLARA